MISDYAELFRRWALIVHMARGQLRASIYRTALGSIWFLLIPIIQIGIYYVLIVVIFQRGSGVETFLLIAMGILHYLVISQGVANSTGSIYGNASILLQIKLDPLVLVASGFLQTLRTAGMGVVVYFLMYLVFGPSMTTKVLAYPLILFMWLWFCWSVSVFVSAAAVFSRDLSRVLPLLVQIVMYMCPVIYSVTFYPDSIYGYMLLNPVAAIFALFQWSLLGAPLPPLHILVILPLTLLTMFLIAHWFFNWSRPRITKIL